ncbi:MAG: hypothetical protein A2285_06640 [Elusimicrobia bacterium RIFOXYA12_FULL_57_11]|nr:MAG: hypothetical protein A2285_06640 [Elusimicrobia bacterium RIFOXYA12_FULL_57_11]
MDGTRAAIERFPLTVAFCAAACVTTWWLIAGPQPEPHLRVTLLMTFGFGAALFYALNLINEHFPLPAPARPAHLVLAGGLFLFFFYFRFAQAEGLAYEDRFAQWVFAVIMLASFAPYIRPPGPLELWQFSRRLLTRGAVSAVYTAALFAGAALALAAIDKLLGLKVEDKAYQYLWTFAGLMFWPLHFMAGTPDRHEARTPAEAYPHGLKLFTQYVLLPLASAYFLILYAYMAKILFTQQWPQGMVSWLTSSASALGLLAFLLLYPVSDAPENRWIKTFSRGFCLAALPLLLMLFAAVYKRIAQYGITEHRYFLVCLGLWLFGMFSYFLLSRRPDIRRVPMTLALLAAITSAGPWGAYSAGLASQSARLQRLLSENGLLAGGKVVKPQRALTGETRQEISGVLYYILRYHGPEPLKEYFPPGDPALTGLRNYHRWEHKAGRDLMSLMGQEYVERRAQSGTTRLSIRADNSGMNVAGYDFAVKFTSSGNKGPAPADDTGYRVELRREERELRVFKGGKYSIDLPLRPLLAEAAAHLGSGREKQALLKTEAENDSVKVRVYLNNISVELNNPCGPEAQFTEGLLLVKTKRQDIPRKIK